MKSMMANKDLTLKLPIIKDYSCTDIEDLENWIPDNCELVDFWMYISVGFENHKGSDDFQVHVVTKKQLSQINNKKHLLIIPSYEGIMSKY